MTEILVCSIITFIYGFFAGYAFCNASVMFEKMGFKSERKRLKQERKECYQARRKYEDYKHIENNLIKHGFLKSHGKQTTTKED